MTKRQRERLKEAGRKIWEGSHGNTPLFHEGVGDLASLIDREWQRRDWGKCLGYSPVAQIERGRIGLAGKRKQKLAGEILERLDRRGEAMKFKVEDQYQTKWVHELQEAPLPDCKLETEGGLLDGWEEWTIEVGSLEELIGLGKWKAEHDESYSGVCNIFIKREGNEDYVTTQDEPE